MGRDRNTKKFCKLVCPCCIKQMKIVTNFLPEVTSTSKLWHFRDYALRSLFTRVGGGTRTEVGEDAAWHQSSACCRWSSRPRPPLLLQSARSGTTASEGARSERGGKQERWDGRRRREELQRPARTKKRRQIGRRGAAMDAAFLDEGQHLLAILTPRATAAPVTKRGRVRTRDRNGGARPHQHRPTLAGDPLPYAAAPPSPLRRRPSLTGHRRRRSAAWVDGAGRRHRRERRKRRRGSEGGRGGGWEIGRAHV